MSKVKEKILLNIVLPMAEAVRGTNASYWYRQITEMNTWSREQITAWQNSRLQKLVRHAYDHTIYYRNLFDSLALKPEDIQTAADLQKLPIITKEIANAHHDEIIPDNINDFRYRLGRTGGTTGEPLQYLTDENVWGYVTAAKMYYWKKTSYRYGDKFVAMGSASLFGKKPSLSRRILDVIRQEVPMNTVNLTDELCQQYAEKIRKDNIRFIYGYAASIYIFTKYVLSNNIDLTQIEAVFTTSENLTDQYRETIEQTYKCRVMDCYGARDAGITAYESYKHNYQVGYNVIAEVINPIGQNTGTLLSTNLLNYTFPLLRYQFGDEVELAPEGFISDYNGQVIKRVIGRTSDILRLENGHNLTATGFSMIMKEFDIVAFDVNKTGVNEVTLRIQPISEKYTNDQEEQIKNAIRRYVGADCTLKLEYVTHFEPLPNGKRRYFMVDDKKNDDKAAKENGRLN